MIWPNDMKKWDEQNPEYAPKPMTTKGVEDGMGAKGCEHGTLTMTNGVMRCVFCQQPMKRTFNKEWEAISSAPATTEVRGKASPEMEQLRDALMKLANEVSGWLDLEPIRLATVMGNTNVAVLRERLTIARTVLDHIEGKG